MTTRLREYWEQITPDPPALDALVEGAEHERRRRRRWAVAGAAALTAVVVLSGVAIQRAFDGPDDVAPSQLIPAPPDGTRWVGAGRAVVAVPEWWTTGETQCLTPVETTVTWFSGAVADCSDPAPPGVVREVSFLDVMDAESGYGEHMLRSMEPLATVDGVEILEFPGCDGWYPGTCRHLFAAPSEGLMFGVTLADAADGDYETIRDSLRILPRGATTVPLDAGFGGYTPTWGDEPEVVPSLVDRIEAAGLRAEVVQAPPPDPGADLAADLVPGAYLGAEPELGSPIESGGTVTITVAPALLPTSDWVPTDPAMEALGGGRISVDGAGCVYLANGNDKTYALWPHGYTTRLDGGVVTILDAGGSEVAREGQEISAGGGSAPPGDFAEQPCMAGQNEVFYIQDQVTVRADEG